MASTIKVDNVQNQPGTNIVSKCGTTTTIGAGAGETINVCAATVNIGRCGGTVALAAGATQTGFGREGSVDWQTGSIKTGTFTAVTGEGYFVNTSGGVSTVNLPAGAAGSIVAVSDYTRTWNSNNVTMTPNGAEKIGGVEASATLDVDGQSATFVYVDGTEGWINVQETQTSVAGTPPFIAATGGNTTITCGDYKTHIFTGPGALCVSNAGAAPGSNTVDYLVVGAGGGGGNMGSGGGGAGGFRVFSSAPGSNSPLIAPAGLAVPVQSYTVTVGGGGAAGIGPDTPGGPVTSTVNGQVGSDSVFSTITSARGGGGSGVVTCWAPSPLSAGGSGGGSKGSTTTPGAIPGNGYPAGVGDSPPVSPAQGFPGGEGYDGKSVSTNGGGGGGAAVIGSTTCTQDTGAAGGAGSYIADSFIGPTAPSYGTPGPTGSTRYFSGGAGGGSDGGNARSSTGGSGGAGGGGNGGGRPSNTGLTSGTVNTGGGGGGGGSKPVPYTGGAGGSGIVIIRYKFQ
jgi:hypothetical protein